jgi:hypothetical protein
LRCHHSFSDFCYSFMNLNEHNPIIIYYYFVGWNPLVISVSWPFEIPGARECSLTSVGKAIRLILSPTSFPTPPSIFQPMSRCETVFGQTLRHRHRGCPGEDPLWYSRYIRSLSDPVLPYTPTYIHGFFSFFMMLQGGIGLSRRLYKNHAMKKNKGKYHANYLKP